MLQLSTLRFISNLKENNFRDWFLANRTAYEEAKSDFSSFIGDVLNELSSVDLSLKGITAKETLFRINKDIRFSKDKSPYKTNFGAGISKEGRKMPIAGYYVHLEPGHSFLAGGIYMPDQNLLKIIREEIAFDSKELKDILERPSFRKHFSGFDTFDKLAKAPKGFDKNHKDVEFLKLKSFIVSTQIKDSQLTDKNAVKIVSEPLLEMSDLVIYLNKLLGK